MQINGLLVMEDIDVVLSGSIPSLGIKEVGLGMSISLSKLKNPTPTNHRNILFIFTNSVPPHDSYGAPVVLPFKQGKVHDHKQVDLGL